MEMLTCHPDETTKRHLFHLLLGLKLKTEGSANEKLPKKYRQKLKELSNDIIGGKENISPLHAKFYVGAITSKDARPKFQGDMLNASFTHVKFIESIKIDEKQNPLQVEFIPIESIAAIELASSGLCHTAKITYKDGHKEIAFIPLLYGLSWFLGDDETKTGTMSKFKCTKSIEHLNIELGIGLGLQAFYVNDEKRNQWVKVGLNHISKISFE
jgi:hypothetical protein